MCDRQYQPAALLMTLPKKGQLLTFRLLPWDTGVETCISVNTADVASPPMMCMWTTNDDLCLHWRCRAVAAVIGGSWSRAFDWY